MAAERALALAAELGLPEPAFALHLRGVARCHLGERQGSRTCAERSGSRSSRAGTRDRRHLRQPLRRLLASRVCGRRSPPAGGDRVLRAARASPKWRCSISAHSATLLAELGRTEAGARRGRAARGTDSRQAATWPRSFRARCSCACSPSGRREGAPDVASSSPPPATSAYRPGRRHLQRQCRVPARPGDANGHTHCSPTGRDREASEPLPLPLELDLPALVRTALALGTSRSPRLVASVEPRSRPPSTRSRRRAPNSPRPPVHAEAAASTPRRRRWREFGNVPERAYALLGRGRCLIALGHAGAEVPLAEARDLFARWATSRRSPRQTSCSQRRSQGPLRALARISSS